LKRFFYTLLKKLPLILAIVIAPLTLFLVLHLRPEFLEFLRLPQSEKKTEKEVELEVDTGADWDREAALCATAEDFNNLAQKAWKAGRGRLSEDYYKSALGLDPENETARIELGYTRFVPEKHLVDFNELLPYFLGDEAKSYINLHAQWLTPSEKKALVKRWNIESQLLAGRRARGRALEESLGTKTWTGLGEHDLFKKIIASWDYRIDGTHPHFVFIIEGEQEPGQEPATAFLDTLASDLTHMLASFRSHWLPAPAEAGDEDDFGRYHVFVLKDPRVTARHAPRLSGGRARSGAVSFLDEATGLLVTSLPADRILYSGSGSSRRAMVQPFGRAILKHLCKRPAPFWLAEGISLLLPMGRGIDSKGALRLNGAGIVNSSVFTDWLAEGILDEKRNRARDRSGPSAEDRIPWPLGLESLLACDSAEILRAKCANDGAFANSLEIYALFCHYLARKKDADFTSRYATPCLAAQPPADYIDTLLAGNTLQSIEQAMVERYISERARGDLTAALRELHGSSRRKPTEKEARQSSTDAEIPFFEEKELLALIGPGMTAELYRTLVIHLARKHGVCRTEKLLRGGLHRPDAPSLSKSGFESEWRDLQKCARFFREKLGALADAEFAYRLGEVEARLIDANADNLIWKPLEEGQDLSTLPDRCRVAKTADAGEITIVSPHTALPLEFAVSRFKKVLAADSLQDRVAYCRLFVFTVDGTRFLMELNSLEGAGEVESLRQRLPLYTDAQAGAGLVSVLAGERSGTATDVIDFFKRQVRKAKGTGVLRSLDRDRIEAVVKSLLYRTFVDENSYLRTRFNGFEGMDEGRARFVYDLAAREQKDDFDFRPSPLADTLTEKLRADTVYAPRSFQLKKERLSAYGSDFVRLRPVFAGAIEIKVSFSFAPKREKKLQEPFYFYFGCTDEEGKEYIASACLAAIDINGRLTGSKAGAGDPVACAADLAVDKTYSAALSCSDTGVAHVFGGARITTPDIKGGAGGTRRGQVFVWVHGPRWFHIEGLEVDAAIDPIWLDSRIAPLVDEEYAKIMN